MLPNKKRNNIYKTLIAVMAMIWTACLTLYFPAPRYRSADAVIIAHAGGGLFHDGQYYTYTNTCKAFTDSYESGVRIFEIDLMFSSDGFLLGVHSWEDGYFGDGKNAARVLSLAEYESHKILGLFGGMSFSAAVDFLNFRKDAKLVLDTKETDVYRFFTAIRQELARKDSLHLAERIIPQLYRLEEYSIVDAILPFDQYIFSDYKISLEKIRLNKLRNYPKLSIIVTTFNRMNIYKEIVLRGGYGFWIHTINNREEMMRCMKYGVNGFFTDTVLQSGVQDSSMRAVSA